MRSNKNCCFSWKWYGCCDNVVIGSRSRYSLCLSLRLCLWKCERERKKHRFFHMRWWLKWFGYGAPVAYRWLIILALAFFGSTNHVRWWFSTNSLSVLHELFFFSSLVRLSIIQSDKSKRGLSINVTTKKSALFNKYYAFCIIRQKNSFKMF